MTTKRNYKWRSIAWRRWLGEDAEIVFRTYPQTTSGLVKIRLTRWGVSFYEKVRVD